MFTVDKYKVLADNSKGKILDVGMGGETRTLKTR
jgi:hypothetical protein